MWVTWSPFLSMAQREVILQVNFHDLRSAPLGLSSAHFDQRLWSKTFLPNTWLSLKAMSTPAPPLQARLHHKHMCTWRVSHFTDICKTYAEVCWSSCGWPLKPNGQEHALRQALLKKGFSRNDVQQDLFSCKASWEMRVFMLLPGQGNHRLHVPSSDLQQLLTAVH